MHYADYREFLQNYFHETKQKNPKWSYGSWAKKLGLKDTSSITKIIQGRREPGNKITEKLVSYFAFTGSEAQYFRNLIQLNKIKPNPQFATLLFERMAKMSFDHLPRTKELIQDFKIRFYQTMEEEGAQI